MSTTTYVFMEKLIQAFSDAEKTFFFFADFAGLSRKLIIFRESRVRKNEKNIHTI